MTIKFFNVQSGYGFNTREPFVEIEFEGTKVQISPEEATEVALSIFEASEAAWSDAFLVEFLQKEVNLDLRQAAQIIKPFREWRLARREKDQGAEGSLIGGEK